LHGIEEPTDFEVAATVLLIYPAFGPSLQRRDKAMKPKFKDSLIPKLLQDDGIKLFKQIFVNNSKEL